MKKNLIMITGIGISIAIFMVLSGGVISSDIESKSNEPISNKIKFNMESLFDIYGYEEHFQVKNGKQIMYNPEFRLNPENSQIYQKIKHDSTDNAVVIFPIFTASAYNEPGFYTFFRGECSEECLTIKIEKEFVLDFTTGGNGFQVLKLLEYPIISDIDVDKDPSIIEKYDKVILLHNEYVTEKEFNAIINHPKVIYLYPNALYAEVKSDYQNNSISLLRGHNYPKLEITNGFDWKYDNSPLEYDVFCKDMKFEKINNGHMLNCYPENSIHQSKVLLEMIKEF